MQYEIEFLTSSHVMVYIIGLWTSMLNNKVLKNNCQRRKQDDGGVCVRGILLSPWIHQEYTFRHRSACRTSA